MGGIWWKAQKTQLELVLGRKAECLKGGATGELRDGGHGVDPIAVEGMESGAAIVDDRQQHKEVADQ